MECTPVEESDPALELYVVKSAIPKAPGDSMDRVVERVKGE